MHYFTNLTPQQQDALAQWATAPNLETLFDLNMQYINGKLLLHPAHPRGLHLESKHVAEPLLKMNEYGMFTSQGQPRTEGGDLMHPYVGEVEMPPAGSEFRWTYPSELAEQRAICRTCFRRTYARSPELKEARQMPYVQFCMPVQPHKTATLMQIQSFIRTLLSATTHIHMQVSWPKGIFPAPEEEYSGPMPWVEADVTTAGYIPKEDLDMYFHFKSPSGTSCAHENRTIGEQPEECGDWSAAPGPWSEVNDFHLLKPRMPEWFLGSTSPTVVFGVNALSCSGGCIEGLEECLVDAAKMCGLPRCFPVNNEAETNEL